MKKKVLAFTLLTSLLAINAEGQVDQKTALGETPDGEEYYQFYGIDHFEDIGYSGKKKEAIHYISHQNNVLGELSYFFIDDEKLNSKDIKGNAGDPKVDHYVEPSLVYTPMNGIGRLILDGLIYEFERNKMENILSGDFTINYIYVPRSVVDNKDDKVKFIQGFKDQKKAGGTPLSISKTVKHGNHIEKIKEYFSKMQKKQKEANANLTAEQKENIAKIDEIRNSSEADRKKIVAKHEAEMRKQRKEVEEMQNRNRAGSKDQVTIINETGRGVCLVQGGSSTSFTSKESFDCDEPVYWGVTTDGGRNCTSNTKGIAVSAGQCGKEVVLK